MHKRLAASVMAGWLLMSSSALLSQDGTTQKKPAASANTATNKRDRNKSEKTADQAKDNTSDRQIMQKIRKAIMEDKSLSTYGHNVKVISEHGRVTLKGPVHTEEERKSIEAKAIEVAGTGNVVNQISIKGNGAKRPSPKKS